MGFLAYLMGRKLIGTATIKFYGEDEASVEYETKVSDKDRNEIDLIHLFAFYYAKMLYNLDRSEPADQLIVDIQNAVKRVRSTKGVNRVRILASDQKLVEPKTYGIAKKYSGELYEKSNQTRIIQTYMSAGGEGYYTPVSTVMFLQYLIKNLSEGSLMSLVLALGGMNKYYHKVGDYYNMRSTIEAPYYGLLQT